MVVWYEYGSLLAMWQEWPHQKRLPNEEGQRREFLLVGECDETF